MRRSHAAGHTAVQLSAPWVALACPLAGAAADDGGPQSCSTGQLELPSHNLQEGDAVSPSVWRIPVGSTAHAEAVSLGTALSALLTCVSVLAVLFRDRLAQPLFPAPPGRAKTE